MPSIVATIVSVAVLVSGVYLITLVRHFFSKEVYVSAVLGRNYQSMGQFNTLKVLIKNKLIQYDSISIFIDSTLIALSVIALKSAIFEETYKYTFSLAMLCYFLRYVYSLVYSSKNRMIVKELINILYLGFGTTIFIVMDSIESNVYLLLSTFSIILIHLNLIFEIESESSDRLIFFIKNIFLITFSTYLTAKSINLAEVDALVSGWWKGVGVVIFSILIDLLVHKVKVRTNMRSNRAFIKNAYIVVAYLLVMGLAL